jgi:hypothetical protein
MEATKKEEQLMLECYRQLFKASTPSADFDNLVENATLNQFGQKEIPFMDYEIDEDEFIQIVDSILKKSRISSWRKESIKRSVLLGCSPKFKQK